MIWDFKNFEMEEFFCKHCGAFTSEVEYHYYGMVFYFLQPLRTHIGKPIHITRGYSCIEHNKKISGAVRSYHIIPNNPTIYHPCAVDFWVPDLTVEDIETYIDCHTDTSFCGYHIYTRLDDTWLCHIDWRGFKARW